MNRATILCHHVWYCICANTLKCTAWLKDAHGKSGDNKLFRWIKNDNESIFLFPCGIKLNNTQTGSIDFVFSMTGDYTWICCFWCFLCVDRMFLCSGLLVTLVFGTCIMCSCSVTQVSHHVGPNWNICDCEFWWSYLWCIEICYEFSDLTFLLVPRKCFTKILPIHGS